MGEVMVERFSAPRREDIFEAGPEKYEVGCWGEAKPSEHNPREISVTVGVRTFSGQSKSAEVELTERQATKLLGDLVASLGFSVRVRNALTIEAYNARYLMPSRLDGLQDAGLNGLEEE